MEEEQAEADIEASEGDQEDESEPAGESIDDGVAAGDVADGDDGSAEEVKGKGKMSMSERFAKMKDLRMRMVRPHLSLLKI